MLRSSHLIRRACARYSQRRGLHEDSREDFLGFSVTQLPGSDPRFGMDMTRAPGYEIAADEDIPLIGNKKLADFAARHARLSATQVEHANGYIWIGSVLYPPGVSDAEFMFSWEIGKEEGRDMGGDTEHEPDLSDSGNTGEVPVIEAKRRYTGGQARRIRKERERNAEKRPSRRSNRPIRRPENDVPAEEE